MKQFYSLFFLVSALLLIACNSRAQKRLVVIGSSTSACFNTLSPDSCYIGMLQRYYNNAGISVVVDNSKAMAGTNVYQGMPTGYAPPRSGPYSPLPNNNITAALAANPDIVLINYPSNEYNVLPISEVMFCLRTMKQAANDAGKPCYITTTQPRSGPGSPTALPDFSTPAVRVNMAVLKDSILNAFGPFAINFWDVLVNPADTALLPQYNYGDGTHLTAAGHRAVANQVIAKNLFTGGALPVTFTSFTAYGSNRQTYIQWTTGTEQDISGYNIEKSGDGNNFRVIRQVPARHLPGTNSYSVTDDAGSVSAAFYRVVALENGGRPSYTKVVRIATSNASFILQKLLVSGPSVKAEIHAAESQPVTLQLVNSTGQVLVKMASVLQAGFNTIALPASIPGKGLYFLRIINSRQEVQVKSFMKE